MKLSIGNITLALTCVCCGGQGEVWPEGEPKELECGECDGKGNILTRDGESLIKFMDKFNVGEIGD